MMPSTTNPLIPVGLVVVPTNVGVALTPPETRTVHPSIVAASKKPLKLEHIGVHSPFQFC
jgi:hypothetical protein